MALLSVHRSGFLRLSLIIVLMDRSAISILLIAIGPNGMEESGDADLNVVVRHTLVREAEACRA